MARRKGSRTRRCQGCNHVERVRIERFLAAGASIKGAARKFAIDYHALRRHWRKRERRTSQAPERPRTSSKRSSQTNRWWSISLVRGALYKGFSAGSELGDGNSMALLAGGCTRISGIADD